jgi:hypothetical protein
MGKSFPDNDRVMLATVYGTDVHKAVETYYNDGNMNVSSDGAKWVIDTLDCFSKEHNGKKTECEVMVSDFEGTASKADVVVHTDDGVYLFDIKTTSKFDREYCSLQLSVYQYLYERNYEEKVLGLFVIGTKSKRLFHVLYQGEDKVNKLLDMNKEELKCK